MLLLTVLALIFWTKQPGSCDLACSYLVCVCEQIVDDRSCDSAVPQKSPQIDFCSRFDCLLVAFALVCISESEQKELRQFNSIFLKTNHPFNHAPRVRFEFYHVPADAELAVQVRFINRS